MVLEKLDSHVLWVSPEKGVEKMFPPLMVNTGHSGCQKGYT